MYLSAPQTPSPFFRVTADAEARFSTTADVATSEGAQSVRETRADQSEAAANLNPLWIVAVGMRCLFGVMAVLMAFG